jgi:hypothetical protein
MSMVDPRTLEPILEMADCHLVPEWAEVSNLCVRLDKYTDNKIGSSCDAQLKNYLEAVLSKEVRGKVALQGAPRPLTGSVHINGPRISVNLPRTASEAEFRKNALKDTSGEAFVESFIGGSIDGLAAYLSAIHSAFLILYYHDRPEVWSDSLGFVRELFRKAIAGTLTNADDEIVRPMVSFVAHFQPENVTRPKMQFREVYNPAFDCGDGVVADFPNKSIRAGGSGLEVIIPYSGSLRAAVHFDV